MGYQDRPYARDDYGRGGMPRWAWWLLAGRVPLFTVFGIKVQLHSSMVIVLGVVLALGLSDQFRVVDRIPFALMLFGIVLLHEFGHCFAARWVGGEADEIVMHPMGGLAMARPPGRPLPTFITVAGGPAVNIVICLVAGAILLMHGATLPLNILRPIGPPFTGFGDVFWWTWFVFYTSYSLLLFNLLPVYPLDGGQMLNAILWPRVGYRKALLFSAATGLVGCVGLFFLGFMTESFGLAILGGFLAYTNWQLWRAARYSTDYELDAPPEESGGVIFAGGGGGYGGAVRYSTAKEDAAITKQRQRERAADAASQQKIDRILAKVSAEGMQSLNWMEKRALAQETERQRAGRQR